MRSVNRTFAACQRWLDCVLGCKDLIVRLLVKLYVASFSVKSINGVLASWREAGKALLIYNLLVIKPANTELH